MHGKVDSLIKLHAPRPALTGLDNKAELDINLQTGIDTGAIQRCP